MSAFEIVLCLALIAFAVYMSTKPVRFSDGTTSSLLGDAVKGFRQFFGEEYATAAAIHNRVIICAYLGVIIAILVVAYKGLNNQQKVYDSNSQCYPYAVPYSDAHVGK